MPKSADPTEQLKGASSALLAHHALTNFYAHFLPMPCSAVLPGSFVHWYQIHTHSEGLSPIQFEYYYGKRAERFDYNLKMLARAVREKKRQTGSHAGMADLFVPVLRRGRAVAVLVSGPFFREAPTEAGLRAQWKLLTGGREDPEGADFLSYARAALSTPVLEGEALRAYEQLLFLTASHFSGGGGAGRLKRQFEELQTKVFSKQLPWRMWAYVEHRRHRLDWLPQHYPELTPWDRLELGLKRPVTSALAVAPLDAREAGGELEALVMGANLQRAAFELCREIPGLVSGRLEGGGAVFLWAPQEHSETKARLEARDLARRILSRLEKKLRIKLSCGVGLISKDPLSLPDSFRGAAQALLLGLGQRRELAFETDLKEASEGSGPGALHALRLRLLNAFAEASEGALALARDFYVREALRDGEGRPDALRVHLLHLLYSLHDAVSARAPGEEGTLQAYSQSLWAGFSKARTTHELISLFRQGLDRYESMIKSPSRGSRGLRLDAARDFVRRNYKRPLGLKEAANSFGYSPSRFSRYFKEQTGTAFSEFLLATRLEQARRLLKGGKLPVNQVALECGFSSPSYFVQAFRKAFQQTPLDCRREGKL